MVVWSPLFWPGARPAYQRDLQRAMKARTRESRVWLDPEAKQEIRLKLEQGWREELILPSETTNVIDVFQIDEHGRVYPRFGLTEAWGGTLKKGLYREVMQNLPKLYYQGKDFKTISWPVRLPDGKFRYEDRKIGLRPASFTPAVKRVGKNSIQAVWGTGRPQEPVHLEAELENVFGPARLTRGKLLDTDMQLVTNDQLPGKVALSTELLWDHPFDSLFPMGASVDHLNHLALMKQCIEDLGKGARDKALAEAKRWVSTMSGRIMTRLGTAWLFPLLAGGNEQEILFAADSKYDLSVTSLEELLKNPKFREIINKPMEVVWTDSWLGYMWCEVQQDIEDGLQLTFCDHCGNLLRGGRRRSYCRASENDQCHRERATKRQRQHRQGNK